MRMIIGTLAVTALVGCSGQDEVALDHRSLQEVQARGVALDESGDIANIGMNSTTCDFNTSAGMIEADYDYDSSAETVVDGGVVPVLGPVNLVINPEIISLTTPDVFPSQVSFDVVGVLDGGLVDGGFVTVQPTANNACAVVWRNFTGVETDSVSTSLDCSSATLSMDDATGTAYLATGEGVHQVVRDGTVTLIDDSANALIAWDASSDALYVGQVGATEVSAFESDGAVRWQMPLTGELSALSEMGSTGRLALSLSKDGAGEFVVLDGLSGLITSDLATPSAASELNVSGSGNVLAVSLASAVHYFDVSAQ